MSPALGLIAALTVMSPLLVPEEPVNTVTLVPLSAVLRSLALIVESAEAVNGEESVPAPVWMVMS